MAKTAAQKIEALLAKATELMDEVPGETKTATMAAAGKALAEFTRTDEDTIQMTKEHLALYDMDAEVNDSFRAGIALAAKLLTNLDLEIDL